MKKTFRRYEQPYFEWTGERVAALCDMVAEGLNFGTIGGKLGCSRDAANGRFRKIRQEMGWQAC